MRHNVLIDTGVLVALINRRDQHHHWVKAETTQIAPPIRTCEAVISETWFLLQRVTHGRDSLLQLLKYRQIQVCSDLNAEIQTITDLLSRYTSVSALLADAELIRMSELYPNSLVFTLDSDFHIYRKNQNQPIPLIIPPPNHPNTTSKIK